MNLSRSYRYCEDLARRQAGNFYHAFRLLPSAQRRAMCALYAFLRIADDLGDGPGDVARKQTALIAWREKLAQAIDGRFSHPIHPALQHTLSSCGIPRNYLNQALDGVEMDLAHAGFMTFADLARYCYHVASVVGLACIHIWGFDDARAKGHAEEAGIAFQLTNILRDLGEDAARGRIYLPREDLERFGYREEHLQRGERNESFHALMQFEVERARSYYESAQPLVSMLQPGGRAVYMALSGTYRSLLDAIEQRDYDVFSSRVELSSWRKLRHTLRALPVRWGWF